MASTDCEDRGAGSEAGKGWDGRGGSQTRKRSEAGLEERERAGRVARRGGAMSFSKEVCELYKVNTMNTYEVLRVTCFPIPHLTVRLGQER